MHVSTCFIYELDCNMDINAAYVAFEGYEMMQNEFLTIQLRISKY